MSLIEKLDGVLALVEKATPGPLIAEDETQDIGRGMLKHYSVVRGADGENIIRLGYTDPNVHAFAAAVNLLRDHGPAIRQAVVDAERYQTLRAENEKLRAALRKIADWHGDFGAFPETNNAWRAMVVVTAREAVPELDAAIDARLASDSEGGE